MGIFGGGDRMPKITMPENQGKENLAAKKEYDAMYPEESRARVKRRREECLIDPNGDAHDPKNWKESYKEELSEWASDGSDLDYPEEK